jgi:hypothetical protein
MTVGLGPDQFDGRRRWREHQLRRSCSLVLNLSDLLMLRPGASLTVGFTSDGQFGPADSLVMAHFMLRRAFAISGCLWLGRKATVARVRIIRENAITIL